MSMAVEEEKSALMVKRIRPNPSSEGGMGGNGMEKSANDSNKGAVHPETAPGLSTSHYHFPTGRRCSPRPIDALRFERVGTHEWSIVETKVYDVCEFMKMLALDMGDTPVCLIDESMLQQSSGFLPKKLSAQIGLGGIGYKSTNDGVMSLTKELTLNNSMITSWTKADRPQLREMACQWQWQKQLPASDIEGDSGSKDETMITFWRSNDTTDFSLGRNSCQGADNNRPCGGGGGAGCHNSCGGCSGADTHDDHNNGYSNGSSHLDEYSVNGKESNPITVPFTVGVSISQQNLIENSLYNNGQLLRQRPHTQHSNSYSNHISQPHIQHVKKQSKGYLVYEQTLQVGVVVRANPAIGVMEDLWCVLFPTELNPLTNTESFGVFLSRLFPQLKALYGREEQRVLGRIATDSINKADFITAVKYYPHQKGHTLNHPPMAPDNSQCYRTVGTVSIAASILLAR